MEFYLYLFHAKSLRNSYFNGLISKLHKERLAFMIIVIATIYWEPIVCQSCYIWYPFIFITFLQDIPHYLHFTNKTNSWHLIKALLLWIYSTSACGNKGSYKAHLRTVDHYYEVDSSHYVVEDTKLWRCVK